MILPIYAYGQPVLKKVAKPIEKNYPDLEKLIEDMWETMHNAEGIGLAAPQIGKSIRLFLVDSVEPLKDAEEEGIRQVFINAEILEEDGKEWAYEEGCLSIPYLRGDVRRKNKIKIRYQDENFEEHIKEFDGINARVIQHEYDHIEGVLFTDKLMPLKRKLIKRKLEKIRDGKVVAEYKMRFKRS